MAQTEINDAIPCDFNQLKTLYSVSQINRLSKELLESQLRHICIEGEISNCVQPKSGHLYFTLKDSFAQLRCAMFKSRGRTLNFKPEQGMQVIATGTVSLYEPRGDYQLIVEKIEQAGLGDLQKAFDQLKKQLQSAGLFQQAHKKPLPAFPRCVGIITSKTGAALQDILQISARRCPSIPIIVYPCHVQGTQAKFEICQAIETANKANLCDVLIVGRGGGSLEDLWAFNEACVAKALFASRIPCVSAVGHEIDFTISDFVADVRAPTPSAAAELVFPEQTVLQQQLSQQFNRLEKLIAQQFLMKQQKIQLLQSKLKHPKQILQETMQKVDTIELKILQLTQQNINQKHKTWQQLNSTLRQANPESNIKQLNDRLQYLFEKLRFHYQTALKQQQQTLQKIELRLNAYNPQATLARGYSIVQKDDKITNKINQLQSGDALTVRMQDGIIEATVD